VARSRCFEPLPPATGLAPRPRPGVPSPNERVGLCPDSFPRRLLLTAAGRKGPVMGRGAPSPGGMAGRLGDGATPPSVLSLQPLCAGSTPQIASSLRCRPAPGRASHPAPSVPGLGAPLPLHSPPYPLPAAGRLCWGDALLRAGRAAPRDPVPPRLRPMGPRGLRPGGRLSPPPPSVTRPCPRLGPPHKIRGEGVPSPGVPVRDGGGAGVPGPSFS